MSTVFSRKFLVRLVALGLSCLFGFIFAELSLRLLWPSQYYYWPPNFVAEFQPSPDVMPGVNAVAHFRVNSLGIRGDEWSADRSGEYRIMAIGGSTTECNYIDQDNTWPALLQDGLPRTADQRRVWVGNLGKSGYNSRDHLGYMRHVVDQHDIDAVLILLGGNDMIHRLMADDQYDPHFVQNEQEYTDWLNERFWKVPLSMRIYTGPLYKRTALYQVAKEIQIKHFPSDKAHIQDSAGKWLIKLRLMRQQAPPAAQTPPLDTALDEFEQNVREMIQLARSRNLRIVFLTQPTIWKEQMPPNEQKMLWWGSRRRDKAFYTTATLAHAMDLYNQRLIDTCADTDTECFDLANRVPRSLDVFYDDIHFNDPGSKLVADELISYFTARPPFTTTTN